MNPTRLVIPILLTLASAVSFGQRYKLVKESGAWWIQTPAKENLFSLGVCVIDFGTKWSDYDLGNPGYAGYRFYPNQKKWAEDTSGRLSGWGFNTIGAWSEYSALKNVKNSPLYLTPILHMGSSAGAPWLDMWAPETVKTITNVAKDQITVLGDKSRVIGYFSDNELGWWRGAMFEWVWKNKTPYTRRIVTDRLKEWYGGSWKALSQDFDAEGAKSFATLRKGGKLFLRPGSKGNVKVQRVVGLLAERYYSLCRSILKDLDPGALYLGDRYISNFYPEVVARAGKYCDVVSTNLNADWRDGSFTRFHLSELTRLTKKPLMVTEYYMSAMENSSGNRNDSSGFPVVQTQAERAENVRRQTELLLRQPNLVGAHWFQYYDEPQHGRGDGENYNFGLVDTSNRPYEDLTSVFHHLSLKQIHSQSSLLAGQSGIIPDLIGSAEDSMTWNRQDGYVKPDSKDVRGELTIASSADRIFFHLIWYEDRFSENLYRSGKVPTIDMTTLSIQRGDSKWQLRIAPDSKVTITGANGLVAHAKYDAKSHLYFSIPRPSGSSLKMNLQLNSQIRTYTTRWDIHRNFTK